MNLVSSTWDRPCRFYDLPCSLLLAQCLAQWVLSKSLLNVLWRYVLFDLNDMSVIETLFLSLRWHLSCWILPDSVRPSMLLLLSLFSALKYWCSNSILSLPLSFIHLPWESRHSVLQLPTSNSNLFPRHENHISGAIMDISSYVSSRYLTNWSSHPSLPRSVLPIFPPAPRPKNKKGNRSKSTQKSNTLCLFLCSFFFFKIYLFIWGREQGRGRRRGRESQADSPLSTEPITGLDLMTLSSWNQGLDA